MKFQSLKWKNIFKITIQILNKYLLNLVKNVNVVKDIQKIVKEKFANFQANVIAMQKWKLKIKLLKIVT